MTLCFINREPQSNSRYLYRIETRRDFATAYQLRVDKAGQTLHVFVDDEELETLTLSGLSDARVGLYSDGGGEILAKNILYYRVKNK